MSGHLGLDLGHAHLGHAKATGRARRLHDVDGELDFADEAVQLLALEGASLLDSNEACTSLRLARSRDRASG